MFPANEYIYSLKRDAMQEAEDKFENKFKKISWAEQTVDHYLQYLKWREFVKTKDTGFPPSRPLEENLERIESSEIYKALFTFPKGGNMHSHEKHDVSRKILLDIVWNSYDFEYLYMLPPEHETSPWTLDFFVNPPSSDPPWINVKDNADKYPKETILKHMTLLDILSATATRYPTDSSIRWKEMNTLWDRASMLTSNMRIKKKYLLAMYEQGLAQGVIYFETRKNIYEEIYHLDTSPKYSGTNGRRYLNPNGDEEIKFVMELAKQFAETHPEFVGHKRISSAQRQSSKLKMQLNLDNVYRTHLLYPDHVIGFDVVGEEDAGYSNIHFLGKFLPMFDNVTGEPKVPFYPHTAETHWPDDLMATKLQDDIAPTLMNTYEAILLKAKRIGHGYGFIKHPYLLNLLRSKQIALEICVASNQLLGYTPDIRDHPGQHYHRYGIPVVLAGDDTGTFGYNNLTVDYYEAFMAWGLDLQDLRTFAVNSFKYSGLSAPDKYDAVTKKWRPMWDKYIAEKYAEACGRDYASEAKAEGRKVVFGGILPSEGSKSGQTMVHVFGLNFESGICQNVTCKFGDLLSSSASYISNQQILCSSPDYGDDQERTVGVFVSLNGVDFIATGFTFAYVYEEPKSDDLEDLFSDLY